MEVSETKEAFRSNILFRRVQFTSEKVKGLDLNHDLGHSGDRLGSQNRTPTPPARVSPAFEPSRHGFPWTKLKSPGAPRAIGLITFLHARKLDNSPSYHAKRYIHPQQSLEDGPEEGRGLLFLLFLLDAGGFRPLHEENLPGGCGRFLPTRFKG